LQRPLRLQSKVTAVVSRRDETTKLKTKLCCIHVEKDQLSCFPMLENFFSDIYLTNGDEMKEDSILHMLQLRTTSNEHFTPET
jgi:hypothetical protein